MNEKAVVFSREASGAASSRGISDLLLVLSRGKWLFLGVFAVAVVAAVLFILLIPPVYEAKASILINTKMAQASIPLFEDQTASGIISNTLQNELEILKSRSLAGTVILALEKQAYLDSSGRSPIRIIQPVGEKELLNHALLMDHIAKRLTGAVSFEPVLKSDVIRVIVKSRDPREAALIANTYARAYQERNLAASRAKSRSVREYLQSQVIEKTRSLANAEDSLKKYMERGGVVSLDDEAKILIDRLSTLRAERDAADIQESTLKQTLLSYQNQLSTQEKDFASAIGEANDPYIRLLQEQVAKLEVQRDITATQNRTITQQNVYNDKLKELDGQIAALRAKLRERTNQFLKTILPSSEQGGGAQPGPGEYLRRIKEKILQTQIDIQALQARRAALDEPIREYERQFERIPAKSIRLAGLQRDKQITERLYLLLEEKFNQASLIEQSEFGSVDIFDPAAVPAEPATARPLLVLMLAAVLGIGGGMGLVFIREHLDPRIHVPHDLRKRGYSVLSVVARMEKEARRKGKETVAPMNRKTVDSHVLAYISPQCATAESYRRLRTGLLLERGSKLVRTVLVTSARVGEGKSTTAANLAVAFAQDGKKVLLVDADLRHPVIHTLFNVRPAPGLTELLTNKSSGDSAVQRTVVVNLDVIPCGAVPPNPAELINSERMREFIEFGRANYNLVLFDSPPVLAVTDPSILASSVDKVLLVVEADKTNVQEFERSVEILKEVQGEDPGIVLNNLNPRFARRRVASEGYGYGYYMSSYGQFRAGQRSSGVRRTKESS